MSETEFVERPRLAEIGQVDLGPGDPMGQFVADHVERDREAVEDRAVAVAEHHLLAVPEGVVVILPVMHAGHQRQPLAVDRVALVGFEIEVEGVAEPVIGFVDADVGDARLTLPAHQPAGLGFAVGRGIDRALHLCRTRAHDRARRRRQRLQAQTLGALRRIEREGIERRIALRGIPAPRHLMQHMRRQDAEDGTAATALAGVRVHDGDLLRAVTRKAPIAKVRSGHDRDDRLHPSVNCFTFEAKLRGIRPLRSVAAGVRDGRTASRSILRRGRRERLLRGQRAVCRRSGR